MNNNVPMDYHGALGVLRTIVKDRPDAILVNEGANTLDLARGIIDMYQPRKRLDVGTWGVMGVGMGSAIAAAVETGKPVLCAGRRLAPSASPAWRSRRSAVTTCRSASSSSTMTASIAAPTSIPQGGKDVATTVFVKGARYDKMMEAFGGVGVHASSPDDLKRAVNEAMDSGKPTLVNAVIDPKPPAPRAAASAISIRKALKAKK